MEAKPNAAWVRVSEIIEKDTDDLVNLCLLLSGIPSPAGKERKVCEAVVAWFKSAGIRSWTQRITEDSANAVAQIKGSGNGKRSTEESLFSSSKG